MVRFSWPLSLVFVVLTCFSSLFSISLNQVDVIFKARLDDELSIGVQVGDAHRWAFCRQGTCPFNCSRSFAYGAQVKVATLIAFLSNLAKNGPIQTRKYAKKALMSLSESIKANPGLYAGGAAVLCLWGGILYYYYKKHKKRCASDIFTPAPTYLPCRYDCPAF